MPRLNHLALMCELSNKKTLNSVLVVEDGALETRRGCSINDERRMKETLRHMRKYLHT